jgi:hypothetical protein
MCENIGKNIAKYRKLNGISQNYLAGKIGTLRKERAVIND